MLVTIKFGLNSLQKAIDSGTTVSDFVGDPDTQAALGFGDNVDVLLDGTVVEGFTQLSDGDHLVIRTKANAKA
jgi:hypothetical protein